MSNKRCVHWKRLLRHFVLETRVDRCYMVLMLYCDNCIISDIASWSLLLQFYFCSGYLWHLLLCSVSHLCCKVCYANSSNEHLSRSIFHAVVVKCTQQCSTTSLSDVRGDSILIVWDSRNLKLGLHVHRLLDHADVQWTGFCATKNVCKRFRDSKLIFDLQLRDL